MEKIRCFDIGGTHIVAADVTADGRIEPLARLATPVHSFAEFIQSLLAHCPAGNAPISVSIAGVISPQSGVMISANIPCLSGRCLQNELATNLAREVCVINDANAFTLAETHFGRAKDQNVVLGIILGSGIGGGVVINGQMINGANGTCGEWGHGKLCRVNTVHPLPDFPCQCGQSYCLDAYGGAIGLRKLFTHIDGRVFSTQQILEAWRLEESTAVKTIDCWLEMVGSALVNTVNFLDPSIVVVGGGLANACELITALDREVGKRRLAPHRTPLLHAAAHGPEQGLLGAALQLLHTQQH